MFELRSWRSKVTAQLVATVMAAIFVLPLAAMVQTSLRGDGVGNYLTVLKEPMFTRFFLNSAIIAAGSIVITYTASIAGAYAFAKLRILGREFLFYALLIALTLPGVMILVPLFITIQRLGLLDTYWAVILPLAAAGIPFCVLLGRNYVSGLDDSIFDAAKVDGCGSFQILWRIVIPLTHPIAAVIVLWSFLGAWNEFLLPLLFLQDPNKQVITQVPTFFASFYGGDQGQIVAASVLITVPVLVMYLCLQRFFERGMTGGVLK
jgi:ABC-type glycerol-3-phosphate transport system permease component